MENPASSETTASDRAELRKRAKALDSLIFGDSNGSEASIEDVIRQPQSTAEADRLAHVLDDAIQAVSQAGAPRTRSERKAPHKHKRERMLEEAMLSHLGEGLMVIDKSQKITMMNETARELLGYKSTDKAHGLAYSKRFVTVDRAGSPFGPDKDPVALAFETERPVRIALSDDYYSRRADGTSFPVNLTASPIFLNKKLSGVVVIFEDITKEKKLDEVKSDFIYIASHQLRTPLTVSTLHTEMLLSGHGGELTKDQREFLTEILYYNKKMAQLLSIFMTVSKIELGTFVMQRKPADLELLMKDVLHELNTQIKNKKLVVTTDFDQSLDPIYTDPEFMRIVFQNLVSNAVKYTPHEGRVFIMLKKQGDEAAIVIEDTGCGIPAKEQDQVFSKLYRGSNTKGHRWDSNGLGLYITKSIVDKCGGKISFRSEESKGTTFYVNVPLGSELAETDPGSSGRVAG